MRERLLKTLGIVFLLAFVACSESVKPEEQISDEKELSSDSSQKEKIAGSSSSEKNRSSSSKDEQASSGRISSSSMTADDWDSTFVDPRDGQVYRTILLGNQLWFGQNLNYEAPDSWCYNDYPPNCDKYGRLYTHASAHKSCPEGWHLPNRDEFYDALYYVLIKLDAWNKDGHLISPDYASTYGWKDGIPSGDYYGVAFLPGGYRTHYGSYDLIGKHAYFVVSGASIGDAALYASYDYSGVWEDKRVSFGGSSRPEARSVRCVYDQKVYNPNDVHAGPRVVEKWSDPPELKPYEGPWGEYEDPRDGHVYKTVDIDGQLWMAQNINYATENSFCYEGDELNCDSLGRLYGLSAIDSVCPAGWKIPSKADWKTLLYSAAKVSGGEVKLGYVLKSITAWEKHEGIDALGFNMLPTGEKYRMQNGNDGYVGLGMRSIMFAVEPTGEASAVVVGSNNFEDDVFFEDDYYEIVGAVGHSIRCLKIASSSD